MRCSSPMLENLEDYISGYGLIHDTFQQCFPCDRPRLS